MSRARNQTSTATFTGACFRRQSVCLAFGKFIYLFSA